MRKQSSRNHTPPIRQHERHNRQRGNMGIIHRTRRSNSKSPKPPHDIFLTLLLLLGRLRVHYD
jgi:hypothetical protein